ncbi:alpha/beta hydrolase [Yinghuangia sp. ASG 101]|uniref:alpha/beta hydrolase n=1 Tax=Yinghuangia sp. ASG 101 TaxID=2896848 RepID=UPI001E2F3D53|nr:alpha/beta hydrolase [Yinghuangia sp. ASG 101]UGQ10731.1 alpha/beta hydrolase [Yinghuangia sp. ASG 101]
MGDPVYAPDILGGGFEATTLTLRDDAEGPAVATLVRRRADAPTRRAVLYVHGFNDYFFQTHLADFHTGLGFDFYALDLRSYGRSLRPHRLTNYIDDLGRYAEELDEAARVVKEVEGHDVLLVNGHSTGGLVTALWAHHRAGRGVVDGLFLNSPFLDLNAPLVTRTVGVRAVHAARHYVAQRPVPGALGGGYGQSLHRDHHGEWAFDTEWKSLAGLPAYAGWVAAVHRGHRAVARGLAIDVPVLVMASAASVDGRVWSEALHHADAVLDANRIALLAPRLGRHVTIVRIEGGMHDLVLSGAPVRDRVFGELRRWIGAYLATSAKSATPSG